MSSGIRSFAVATALFIGTLVAGAGSVAAQAIDLTGVWTLQVETEVGGGSPTVTLVQEGERLRGRYESQQLGNTDLTGTIQGAEFRFSFVIDLQGMPLTVTLAGTAESNEAVRGTFDLGGFSTGTFTGRPREDR